MLGCKRVVIPSSIWNLKHLKYDASHRCRSFFNASLDMGRLMMREANSQQSTRSIAIQGIDWNQSEALISYIILPPIFYSFDDRCRNADSNSNKNKKIWVSRLSCLRSWIFPTGHFLSFFYRELCLYGKTVGIRLDPAVPILRQRKIGCLVQHTDNTIMHPCTLPQGILKEERKLI